MPSYPQLAWSAQDVPELLRPAIEKYRDAADDQRQIPAELLGQLRANGAFRLNTPRELGGFELPVGSTMNVIERLARIDGPVAWVVWNLNVGVGAAFMSESSVDRIWSGGPDPLIAHSSQPGRLVASGDAYRLSGEWKLVSGADSAEWFGLLAIVMDGGQPRMTEAGPDVRFCVVPRSSVTVHDTWHATAMRGTDSNTVIADDVAVAADMTVVPTAAPRIDRPLFRVPIINQLTSGGAAVMVGMAQAAIDEVVALSQAKTGPDGVPLAHQPRIQAVLGQAAARLGAARALLLATVGALDAAAAAGRRPATEAERGAMRGALCHTAETARGVLTSMYELGSSAVLHESSRLGRIFRDGHAGAQHVIMSAAHYELAGRTLLGLPAGDPFL
jgi:alkylation response protein AidB-like acyl-CoA dehydrogenase